MAEDEPNASGSKESVSFSAGEPGQKIPPAPKRGFLLFLNTIFSLLTLFNAVRTGFINLAREQGSSQTNFLVSNPDSLSYLQNVSGFNYVAFYLALALFVIAAFFWFSTVFLRRQDRLSNGGVVLVVANIIYLLVLIVLLVISFLLSWGISLI